MSENEKADKVTLMFKKLAPKPGEVIHLKFPEGVTQLQMMRFMDSIKADMKIPEGVTVLATVDSVDISVVSEHQMRQLGWKRIKDA